MSRVTEVRLRIKLAANSKTIEVRGERSRLAKEVSGQMARLAMPLKQEIPNSMRSLEDLILNGINDDFKPALDNDYFRVRFNAKELHAMICRLEEISIHADLEKKVWRFTTHSNGSFKVFVTKVNDQEVVDIENLTLGYSCSIRNIVNLIRKDVKFKMDLTESVEA